MRWQRSSSSGRVRRALLLPPNWRGPDRTAFSSTSGQHRAGPFTASPPSDVALYVAFMVSRRGSEKLTRRLATVWSPDVTPGAPAVSEGWASCTGTGGRDGFGVPTHPEARIPGNPMTA